ncbi:unnamed protein product [Cylindrotheca closterium]|uniref:RING-type domain-containing protein n=1 Tax=Cylindrotheca closterium TaxID=2856 RepID=A0AAD2PUA6_9STRA|nr:unnamed protein product [Cylindrotheca closterium]
MNFTNETTLEPTTLLTSSSSFGDHDDAVTEQLKQDMMYFLGCVLVFLFAVCGTMFFDKRQQTEQSIKRIRLIMQSLVTQSVGKDGPERESKGKQEHHDKSAESEGSSTDGEHSDVENPIGKVDAGGSHQPRQSAIQRWKQLTSKIAPNSTRQTLEDEEDQLSETEEGDVCPICIMPFEEGDEACWSKNPECDHVFHTTCLKPWLMAHSECPCCRKDYLSSGQSKNKDQEKKKKDETNLRDLEFALDI